MSPDTQLLSEEWAWALGTERSQGVQFVEIQTSEFFPLRNFFFDLSGSKPHHKKKRILCASTYS